jgi:hypothetical protein
MGLTLAVERKLEDVGLMAFYDADPQPWKTMAEETHKFVKEHFPQGDRIRRDDLAKSLISYIEVDDKLKDFLALNKLRQKYWIEYFADLVADRTWNEIVTVPNGEQP